ncbi:MAG: putative SOS response-associated peptidase YedK [Gammaproteobacteria bacterium]|nr:putative SOS response-associated peptidase YedK [Gammaproteobacteria bacterium]
MCGRYASYKRDRLRPIEEALDQHLDIDPLPVRYNIAPSQPVIIVRPAAGTGFEAALATWGLVPAWSKEPKVGYSTINARAENVAKSPAFRSAYRHRRCLVPADGFYEWHAVPGQKLKQPYFICMADDSPFAFAGLWERWRGEGKVLDSCAILTTEANPLMATIHSRMPVILAPEDYRGWMQREADAAGALMKPYPAEKMIAHRVSTRVNSPRTDDEQCLQPLPGAARR